MTFEQGDCVELVCSINGYPKDFVGIVTGYDTYGNVGVKANDEINYFHELHLRKSV